MALTWFALVGTLILQAPDSGRVLPFDAFLGDVEAHHPVARAARLAEVQAQGELRAAKGKLYDPVLSASWDRKTFDGKTYYDYVEAGVKVPTPLGVDLKLGYERTRGSLVNPDRTTPDAGLLVAGVSVPLARGVLTDERRNAVAEASALRDAAAGERAAALNKLLFAATKDYAAWYEASRRREIAREGVELAGFRLRAIGARFRNGDAAGIDTVEASLELQRRVAARLEADAAYFAATQVVAGYLWDERGAALDLTPGTRPSRAGLERTPLDTTAVDGWLAAALRDHPDVLKAAAKLRQAQANRRLAGQALLPEVRAEGAALADDASAGLLGSDWPTIGDHYKLGITATSSLLLMRERGKLGAARAKLDQQELGVALTRREIELSVAAAVNDLLTLERLLDVQTSAVSQARALRDGEARRFDVGESTLFLVNQRDRTVLDEQTKLAAYEAKYAAARAALAVALGRPARLPEPRS